MLRALNLGDDTHGHQSIPLRRTPDDVPGSPAASGLDVSAVVHDRLFLVPALQPSATGREPVCGLGKLLLVRHRPELQFRDDQHVGDGRRYSDHHDNRRCPVRSAARSADVWPGDHPDHGHCAVLRDADGFGTGLEKHVHEPGERNFRAFGAKPGNGAHRFLRSDPARVHHLHRLVAMAAVCYAHIADSLAITGPGAT